MENERFKYTDGQLQLAAFTVFRGLMDEHPLVMAALEKHTPVHVAAVLQSIFHPDD